jgi:hypothetical protein
MKTGPGPTLWTRLPAGGWQVGFWVDVDGRTLVDVVDPWGTLAYRAAGARRAAPSIDAGWAGCTRGPDASSQYWALAIGHIPVGLAHEVSFENSTPEEWRAPSAETLGGLRVVDDGLWVAAAIGSYTHVRLTARSTALRYPLHMVAE